MLSVGIIEDDEELRKNIIEYIAIQDLYYIAFSVSNIDSLKTTVFPPQIILLDINLNGQNSLHRISYIKELFTDSRIIVMTGELREEVLLESIKAGASSFINKPFSMTSLMKLLEDTLANGTYLNPENTNTLFRVIQSNTSVKNAADTYGLTEKETSIVKLLIEGNSYLEIAVKFNVTLPTITHQIRNLSIKMGVDNKRKLMALLMQMK